MANVNVRIDEKIKERAESVINSLGLTPSAAINLFYIQIIRTNSIPFMLKAEIPNEETMEAYKEAEEDMKNPSSSKGYKTVKELLEDLKSEL